MLKLNVRGIMGNTQRTHKNRARQHVVNKAKQFILVQEMAMCVCFFLKELRIWLVCVYTCKIYKYLRVVECTNLSRF